MAVKWPNSIFSAKIRRIGAKLGLRWPRVVLVAGMIASEQITATSIEALVATADKQQPRQ